MKENKVYFSIVNKSYINLNINTQKLETCQAKILLKNMLDYFGIEMPEINISRNGKPYFKDSKIFFNYSHSRNYIACAIGLYEVGIDIEETSRYINDNIAKKYLDDVIGNKKRVETWVKKEAYSKLIGLGLHIKFQNIKLKDITNKNFLISKKKYLCSIYCANDIEFEELNFSRKILF